VSSGIRQSAAVGEPATIEDTEILDATVNELAAGVRGLLVRLRPPLLDEQGLQWALQDLVSAWNLRQRAARQPPLRAELTLPARWPAELDEATSLGLYRACQEALTNAARYADAREPVRLSVTLAHGRLCLSVRNACSSSPPNRAASGTGLGLGMMAERVRARGGDLHAAREPAPAGDAFVLTLQWPLRPVSAHA
jgi:signal transduction histidine kinase